MNTHPAGKTNLLAPVEKKSVRLLMEKMGMSRREVEEINNKYGVSASKLVELMQLSKYQFVYTARTPGQCEPCTKLDKISARPLSNSSY
jgi:hypothetical protein